MASEARAYFKQLVQPSLNGGWFRNLLLRKRRRTGVLAEVACVGNSKTRHTACMRLSAAALLHTLNPIKQLFRFIRPATCMSKSRNRFIRSEERRVGKECRS